MSTGAYRIETLFKQSHCLKHKGLVVVKSIVASEISMISKGIFTVSPIANSMRGSQAQCVGDLCLVLLIEHLDLEDLEVPMKLTHKSLK